MVAFKRFLWHHLGTFPKHRKNLQEISELVAQRTNADYFSSALSLTLSLSLAHSLKTFHKTALRELVTWRCEKVEMVNMADACGSPVHWDETRRGGGSLLQMMMRVSFETH